MTSDVILTSSNSYFSMKKFEDSILNRGIERQKRLVRKKVFRIVDIFLMLFMIILIFFLMFVSGRLLISKFQLMSKNNKIEKLNIMLKDKVTENEELLLNNEINDSYQDIKMKAYLDLNMINPTEKNIIYFDKTDSEYVRQYENIK